MRYVKWILAGIVAIIGYKVYLRMKARQASANPAIPSDKLARQPGMVANLLDDIKGVFSFGANPTVPPIPGGYGFVGPQPPTGTEPYAMVPSDTRIPAFLVGVTGGVQDPAMPGAAPPPVVGGPPPIGSAPNGSQPTNGWLAVSKIRAVSLVNTNPFILSKSGAAKA